MIIKILSYILYIPFLLIWSVVYGLWLGVYGSFFGAIQKSKIFMEDSIAKRKYAPLRSLRNYYFTAVNSEAMRNKNYLTGSSKKIKLKESSLILHFIFVLLAFVCFLPFYLIYGLIKAPIVVFLNGIRFWRIYVLKEDLKLVYQNWGKTYDD